MDILFIINIYNDRWWILKHYAFLSIYIILKLNLEVLKHLPINIYTLYILQCCGLKLRIFMFKDICLIGFHLNVIHGSIYFKNYIHFLELFYIIIICNIALHCTMLGVQIQ